MSKKIIPPAPGLPQCPPKFVIFLISIVEKKINENYVEFDFSMGTGFIDFLIFLNG